MTIYISDVKVGTEPILVPGDATQPRVIIPETTVWVGDENIVPGNGVPIARGRHHMVLPGEWWVVSNQETEIDLRIPDPNGELEAYVRSISPTSVSSPPPDTTEYIPADREFVVYFEDGNLTDWPSFVRPEWTRVTKFVSVKHVNAPNPLALMLDGDTWVPHPDAAIYGQLYV